MDGFYNVIRRFLVAESALWDVAWSLLILNSNAAAAAAAAA